MITWTAANTSTAHNISAICIPSHCSGIRQITQLMWYKNSFQLNNEDRKTSGKYQDEQEKKATQNEDEDNKTRVGEV